jgi:hypothetical protein
VRLVTVAGIPGSFQFAASTFTVDENAGTATITVARVDGGDGPVSVVVSTSDGTAVAGVNYLATSTSLFFADGVTSQTFTIPILEDGKADGDKTVMLALSAPAGDAAIGTPSSAVLVVRQTNQGAPISQAPLVVTSLRRLGVHTQPTDLVVSFSGPLEASRATNLANYAVVSPGRDGRYGTRDDVTIPISSATYDPTSASVTLRMGQQLDTHKTYRLTVSGTAPGGLTGLTGVYLDGNRDNQPGGNYSAPVNSSTLDIPGSSGSARTTRRKVVSGTTSAKRGGARVKAHWAGHLANRMGIL